MSMQERELTDWLQHHQELAEIGDLEAERMLDDRERVLAQHDTVADRIRALHALGYQRTDIAAMLGKSYQHVRNVLVADTQAARRPPEPPRAAAAGPATNSGGEPDASVWRDVVRLRVRPDGSVLLPPEVLERLGSKVGGMIVGDLRDGEMLLRGPQAAIGYAQTLAGPPWKPGEPMLSEELIADRREEDRGESEGG